MRGLVAQEGPDNLSPSTIELRTTTRRQLAKLRQLQQVYQPELHLAPLSPDDDVLNVPLFLPSSLAHDTRSESPKLVTMEKDLRLGQCYDALDALRIHLHSRSRLLKDKYVNVRHQGPNTKSRELVSRVSSRISVAADRYTAAYSALDALDTDPTAEWQTEFRALHANDIRGVSEPSLPDHPDPERASAILARTLLGGGVHPEGNHTPSWIWRGAPTSDGAVSGYNEGSSCFSWLFDIHLTLFLAYQLEWSKSYTRSQRWQEEVELLKEEMRRTLEFFKWKSSVWLAKTSLKSNQSLSPALREGLNAYAFRQADVYMSLHDHFLSLWKGLTTPNPDHPAPIPIQTEEAMEGTDGGDTDMV